MSMVLISVRNVPIHCVWCVNRDIKLFIDIVTDVQQCTGQKFNGLSFV